MRLHTVVSAILIACVSWLGVLGDAQAQSRAAVRHYERGREYYQAGRYPEAAVELEEAREAWGEAGAKAFAAEESHRFVNGVLDKVIKQLKK